MTFVILTAAERKKKRLEAASRFDCQETHLQCIENLTCMHLTSPSASHARALGAVLLFQFLGHFGFIRVHRNKGLVGLTLCAQLLSLNTKQ